MYEDEYRGKEKERESFGTCCLERLENITVPQHLPGHLWAKGKSAATKPPGAVLWRKRGQWRVGSLGRKREPWLRIAWTSGGRVVRPYAQQSARRIGEVR